MNLRLLVIATVSLALSGCALFGSRVKPIEVKTVAEERVPLNLDMPAPFAATPPQWILITPANSQRVWDRLRENRTDQVLFALTDDGYESISVDMAKLRNIIEQQRQIILEYKKYYEAPKKPPAVKDGDKP